MEQPAEQLVSHHAWLRRLARRMARSSASADDLVQETWPPRWASVCCAATRTSRARARARGLQRRRTTRWRRRCAALGYAACVRCTHADGSGVTFCDPLTQ
jgi:DNA-directed RNA polymerase specialized sigma24 family protein